MFSNLALHIRMSVREARFWMIWCVTFVVVDLAFAAFDIATQKWGFAIFNLIMGGIMFWLANVYYDVFKLAKLRAAKAAHPAGRDI